MRAGGSNEDAMECLLTSAFETSQWLQGLTSCSTRASSPPRLLRYFESESDKVLGECHGF